MRQCLSWREIAECRRTRCSQVADVVAGADLATASARGVAAAPAQTYPNRPIRLIVGFPPGGAVDIIARLYAQGLSVRLGQPVVVENKPGTGGNLASDIVAKAAPDGYTLLHGTENVFISNPHVYGARMPFDPFKDLVPVTSLVSNQIVLTVQSVGAGEHPARVRRAGARAASRRCSMPRSATAAIIIWRWRCSSSTSASI